MRKEMSMLVAATVALTVVSVGVIFAATESAEPIPDTRQTRLLDRFGEQGIDANRDGTLTHEEVRAFFAEKHQRGAAGMHGLRGGKHHGMKGHMDYGEMTEERRAKMLEHHPLIDTDGDGLLSEGEFEAFRAQRMEEHRAMVLEHHPEADADEDGVLTDAEFESFHAQQKGKHRAKMLECHPEADTDSDGALSEEEVRIFTGDHHGGSGCAEGHGRGHGHGECAGHRDKTHAGCPHDKDGGHGGHAHDKNRGHGGHAHHEGETDAGHAGHQHHEHGGCGKGK